MCFGVAAQVPCCGLEAFQSTGRISSPFTLNGKRTLRIRTWLSGRGTYESLLAVDTYIPVSMYRKALMSDRTVCRMPYKGDESCSKLLDCLASQICAMLSFLGIISSVHVISTLLSAATAQSLLCGTLGYHNENVSYYMGNFFYNALSSFTLCAAFCVQDDRCQGFRYSYWDDADTQYCEFFDEDM